MSEAAVLKEFLVSLGFKINKGDERKFIDSVAGATVQVVSLGAAITATASAVVAGVGKIAEGLETLYFAAQRTNDTVDNLQASAFAAKQLGSDAGAALGTMENLARFLRNSPGAEGLLKNIGIQTRTLNGEMRGTTELIEDLGAKFKVMPYYLANAYAQALGIDEKTLMAMRQGMSGFGDQYKQMLKAAGLDAQDAAEKSHNFMNELRLLGAAGTVMLQKIASMLTGRLGENIRKLRELFVANFQHIADVITKVLGFILKLADAVSIMAMRGAQVLGRLINWFDSLSDGAKNIIKWLGLILVGWRLLSAGFLATPLGRIAMLITSLALLWDDYQTWKEGGDSLIDWAKWSPGIEAALNAIKTLGGMLHDGLEFMGDWRPAFELVLAYVAGTWLFGMLGSIGKVVGALGGMSKGLLTRLLGPAGMVIGAGVAGYAAGTLLYNKAIAGTKGGDAIGKAITETLAHMGNKDAQETVARRARFEAAEAGGKAVGPASVRPATGPRGIRNNNPGNLNYANQQGATKEDGPGGRFAVFQTAEDGIAALARQLRLYASRGIDSIRAIISKYAPAGENNTEAYIASVAKKLGVDQNAKLNFKDPAQMTGMVDAIVRVENGKNPYSKEMINSASMSANAQTGKQVGITQTTNITVNGSNDAKGVARDISSAQNGVNEQLVRNTKGAVR